MQRFFWSTRIQASRWRALSCSPVLASTCLLTDALRLGDLAPEVGRQGDYAANVLKVNIPRNDLSVTVAGVKTPTAFGFGGWVAMTKGRGGENDLMGDLVLTQAEVNPVMSALLDNGFDV